MSVSHGKPVFHHRLHGKIRGGSISLTLTRAEARALIQKWSGALKRSARGHRTYFIMELHKGRAYDRMTVETHHHVTRKRSAEDAKPWCRL